MTAERTEDAKRRAIAEGRPTFPNIPPGLRQRDEDGQSERLLARLGVLRCGTCGSRMVTGTANKTYVMYRCPPVGDCPRRVTISATVAESTVVETARAAIEDMQGTATLSEGVADAERDLAQAEQELDAAIRAFSGLDDVEAARERLTELRDRPTRPVIGSQSYKSVLCPP